MDMQASLKRSNKKINSSPLALIIASAIELLDQYPLNFIDAQGKGNKKEKRENEIAKFIAKERMYQTQRSLSKPYGEYTNSLILIENNMAMPYMIEEVADLCLQLDKIQKLPSKVSQFPELKDFYTKLIIDINMSSKSLMDAAQVDLNRLSSKYEFEYSNEYFMTEFKLAQKRLKENKDPK
jgi:hypothetical protein